MSTSYDRPADDNAPCGLSSLNLTVSDDDVRMGDSPDEPNGGEFLLINLKISAQ